VIAAVFLFSILFVTLIQAASISTADEFFVLKSLTTTVAPL
jgi:hypothetical protein